MTTNGVVRVTLLLAFLASSAAYAPLQYPRSTMQPRRRIESGEAVLEVSNMAKKWIATTTAGLCLASILLTTSPAFADEYGVETEAPTLFTGESVMICTKRGLLGACLETAVRTADNDNDKSAKYFSDPTNLIKEKEARMRASSNNEGSLLIEKLRQQTEQNKEKNDLLVKQKTAQNDQGASFGPFDRQVVILNTDGRTFTLLQNPQAMRLKQAGFIEDRRFVKQPTQEDIDAALVADDDGFFAGALKSIFGSSGDDIDES